MLRIRKILAKAQKKENFDDLFEDLHALNHVMNELESIHSIKKEQLIKIKPAQTSGKQVSHKKQQQASVAI